MSVQRRRSSGISARLWSSSPSVTNRKFRLLGSWNQSCESRSTWRPWPPGLEDRLRQPAADMQVADHHQAKQQRSWGRRQGRAGPRRATTVARVESSSARSALAVKPVFSEPQ